MGEARPPFVPHARYSARADAIYVWLREASVATTRLLDADRSVDCDGTGRVVGIEFRDVSSGIDLGGVPSPRLMASLIKDVMPSVRIRRWRAAPRETSTRRQSLRTAAQSGSAAAPRPQTAMRASPDRARARMRANDPDGTTVRLPE